MKAFCLALVALAAATPALAATQDNPLAKDKVVLDLRNLDLATVQGQRLLAIRMDQAARDVCGDRVSSIHLAMEEQSRACRAEVTADIRARIEGRSAKVALNDGAPVRVASR